MAPRMEVEEDSLYSALKSGDLKNLRIILNGDLDRLFEGKTILMWASQFGYLHIVNWLLEHGADVNLREPALHRTALHFAAMSNEPRIIAVLAEHGADLNIKYRYKYINLSLSPYYELSEPKHLQSDYTEPRTPLHVAVNYGSYEALEKLIQLGADVNEDDVEFETPLFKTIESNCMKCAKVFLDNGARVNQQRPDGKTALFAAVEKKHVEMVDLLISYGANVNALWETDLVHEKNFVTPIQYASMHGLITIIERLRNVEDIEEINPLTNMNLLFFIRDRKTAEFLNDQDVNHKSFLGMTPFSAAVVTDNIEVMDYLLSRGADINSIVEEIVIGRSAFMYAILYGTDETVEFFMYRLEEIDLEMEDSSGRTALFHAVSTKKRKLAKQLLAENPTLHRDKHGKTVCHVAAGSNDLDILSYLLDHDFCRVNDRDYVNGTALIYAVAHNHFEVAVHLLRRGADPEIARTANFFTQNFNRVQETFKCDGCAYPKESYEQCPEDCEDIYDFDVRMETSLGNPVTPLFVAAYFNYFNLAEIMVQEFKAEITPEIIDAASRKEIRELFMMSTYD